MIDRAVGLIVKCSCGSFKGISAIADVAESESVRLRALLSILSQMIAVSHLGALGPVDRYEGAARCARQRCGARALTRESDHTKSTSPIARRRTSMARHSHAGCRRGHAVSDPAAT